MTDRFEMRMADWKEQLDGKLHAIINDLLYPEDFKRVLEYALFPGGKRLRPILFLAWHELFSDVDDYALEYACGLEILHTYSLVHDDMPCMDNDELRRGVPTLHTKYGEGMALLAGDALMDLAYRILYKPVPNGNVAPLFAAYAPFGDNGLICGQYLDLFGRLDDIDDLFKVHALKTGALISFACSGGSALGRRALFGVEHETDDSAGALAAADFGAAFGIAFQLYDDISEYIDGQSIGKTNALNFVDLDEAKAALNLKLNDAAYALNGIAADTEFLRRLLDRFVIA